MSITLRDNGSSYSWIDVQGEHCVLKASDNERLAALLADPTTIIIPYVPPPPPTPTELRAREYRRTVDEWTSGVMRYQVLLALIPDTPENAARRLKVQQRLTAARQTIYDLTTQIEVANPDVP